MPRYSRRTLLSTLAIAPFSSSIQDSMAQDFFDVTPSFPAETWQFAEPGEENMASELLDAARQRIEIDTPLLSGMVVVRNGRIVMEHYQNGTGEGDAFHVWSVSKSITNIAVGLAVKEGLFRSLDQTLGELIADRIPAGADPRVATISLEHLLTMTAGWFWDGTINFSRAAETDNLDLMMSRQMRCSPGECFEYDSGCSNLLAYAVQQQSGMLMADFLDSRLFKPLGMVRPEWIVTSDGLNRGGGGAFLTLRDMAKIGLLYLNQGKWGDSRIVDLRWVLRSTRPQATGVGALSGVNIGTGPYGYHWWVASPGGRTGFSALGYGGQVIVVVPSLDMVVTAGFAGADPARPDLQQRPLPIIENFIIPAAQ
ncbi:serine hydrolase [soil metagenome]